MCLFPRKIRVRSKVLDMQGGQPFYITVPCGHCSECVSAKRDEWFFRSYYEAMNCMDNGGYVLFDTLTYNDGEVPHISDIDEVSNLMKRFGLSPSHLRSCDYMAFDRTHIDHFMKRLRRKLQRLGYKSSDCFKYFLTSEYGTNDDCTHRPHYHVLFFVYDETLDPLVLSKLINDCWQHGRTDGIDYHSVSHVLDHVYGKGYTTDMLACQKACGYVAKYITKDSHFEHEIRHRIFRIMDKLFGYQFHLLNGLKFKKRDWFMKMMGRENYFRLIPRSVKGELEPCVDYTYEDLNKMEYLFDDVEYDLQVVMSWKDIAAVYESLFRCVGQFHLQSHGFGADYLKYNKYEDVMKEGLIRMSDSKRGIKYINLPRYYQMRTFYDKVKDFNGHEYYALNDEGKRFKVNMLNSNRDRLFYKFTSWRDCMLNHDYYYDDADVEWYDKLISRFNDLNKGRSLRNFVDYLLFYRGRIKSKAQFEREERGIHCVDDLSSFVSRFNADITEDSDVLYNYATPTDRERNLRGVYDSWLGDSVSWSDNPPSVVDVHIANENCFSSYCFSTYYVMDDTCDPSFENYDTMYDIYRLSQLYRSKFKQKSFDNEEDLKYRLKKALNL